MEKLTYQVDDATIAEVLGISNFTNANSAVLEIVKNAYDAGSPALSISFEDDKITFVDSGKGMDATDIKAYWMYVGKTSKGYAEADENGDERILAGSKGVGRFALARLGERVDMHSKKAGDEGVTWKTDWNSSTLEPCPECNPGTTIEVTRLRDRWTKRSIDSLCAYLSRAYNDDKMAIEISSKDGSRPVTSYFDRPKLGVNCLEMIRFSFDADRQEIDVEVQSDEFKESVQDIVGDVDITGIAERRNAVDEIPSGMKEGLSKDEVAELLKSVGSFSAELYFSLSGSPSTQTAKYQYKHPKLSSKYEPGVILYRNAFSISSFEGTRDWIGLDARSRKSPAGPAHPTGSWRVRFNQIAGRVDIDKRRNPLLRDLANRQGLEENVQFEVFIAIIDSALKVFERYRQSIMRAIDKAQKAEQEDVQNPEPVISAIASGRLKRDKLDDAAFGILREELKTRNQHERQQAQETKLLEERYRYDARILNVLATSGLKASSIAHQLKNDENSILNNSRYIRQALERYGVWDAVTTEETTRIAWRSVPDLLEKEERINRKVATFIGSMLGDIEKGRFDSSTCDLNVTLQKIADRWNSDYAQAKVEPRFDRGIVLKMPEDVVQVIFDNLILNSLQQNSDALQVGISIFPTVEANRVKVDYHDDGAGLDERYHADPRRILEVHETTRPNGHGLGMWIVNNSLASYGCEVLDISTSAGFSISFTLKG
ncbi:MAG: sensor histidine kinase [Eggerthellaceae bacterium]|nr:sensor histidine kinase [Eggerthellaceae bacterium]